MEEVRAAFAGGIIQREITNRNARVGFLQDLVDRIRRDIEQRGADMTGVPGGSSGRLVKIYRGKGSDTPVYKFDAALVKQMRDTCRQVAIEVGQWSEKRAIASTSDLAERLRAARLRKLERQTPPTE